MKIISALIAVYWGIVFVLFLCGKYEPSGFTVGVLILYVAFDLVLISFQLNRKEGAK